MPNTKYLMFIIVYQLSKQYIQCIIYISFCLLLLEFKETYLLEFLNLTDNNSIDIICSEYIFAFLKRYK